MISTIVGKPGTGKSLYLTKIVCDELQKGVDVFANYPIDEKRLPLKKRVDKINAFLNLMIFFSNLFVKNKKAYKNIIIPNGRLFYWTDLQQFKNIEQATIIMDEAQTYFSARRWKLMSAEMEIKFQQHRKQGLDIYAGVQNLARCDKIIRELTAEVLEMHRFGKTFWFKTYEPEEVDKADRKSSYTKFFRMDMSIANAYNTNELINEEMWNKEQEEIKKTFVLMSDFIATRLKPELPPALAGAQ